jgi:hypothetical protein
VAAPGGYLVADDVVQAYQLPRYLHDIPPPPSDSGGSTRHLPGQGLATEAAKEEVDGDYQAKEPSSMAWDLEEDEDPMEEVVPSPPVTTTIAETGGGAASGDASLTVAPLTMNKLILQQEQERLGDGSSKPITPIIASASLPVTILNTTAVVSPEINTGRRLRSQTKHKQHQPHAHDDTSRSSSSAPTLSSTTRVPTATTTAGLFSSAESRKRRRTRADDDKVTSGRDPMGVEVSEVPVPVTHALRSRKKRKWRAGSDDQADPVEGKEEEEDAEDKREDEEAGGKIEGEDTGEGEDIQEGEEEEDGDVYEDKNEEDVSDFEVLPSGPAAAAVVGRRRGKTMTNRRDDIVSATGNRMDNGSPPKRTRRSITSRSRVAAAASAATIPKRTRKPKGDTAADLIESVSSLPGQQQQPASTRVLRSQTARSGKARRAG